MSPNPPHRLDDVPLLPIPVLDTGRDFPFETLVREEERAHSLIGDATRGVPQVVLRSLDAVSRRWLEKHRNAHLPEIAAIAHHLGRPGAYFLAVNYEWGCTNRVGPAPEAEGLGDPPSARLVRTLDWATPGLGRNVIAARVAGKAGVFITLTWPGYTGVIQAMAPQRFAAALNQAPMRRGMSVYPLDWAANRARVWGIPDAMPTHLLREVFETAASFAEARALLTDRPISSPAIFTLVGIRPEETVIIERTERDSRIIGGPGVSANHWQSCGWHGRSRGVDSLGRARLMRGAALTFDPSFSWLVPPVLNWCTRLVMIADATMGRLMVQGYEREAPATQILDIRGTGETVTSSI